MLYNHGGSGNHGCEAIVRSMLGLLKDQNLVLYSDAPAEDYKYGLSQSIEIRPTIETSRKFNPYFLQAYYHLKVHHNYTMMDVLDYRKAIRNMEKEALIISIGGDVYCYDDYKKYIKVHQLLTGKSPTVLVGCSMEERLFRDQAFIQDMHSYRYISARESLTYQLLKDVGVNNLEFHPDTAFLLPKELLPLPQGFQEGNTIGINLSPLVVNKEKKNLLIDAMVKFIFFVLEYTDCSIALIPHVVWRDNDDRTVLQTIYKRINQPEKVVLISDCNCQQLKGYISRCRFFIGARTHATIAAYSSCVPTIAIGYSLKAKGIAYDLYGTEDNYVLPYSDIKDEHSLIDHFQWLMSNEVYIRNHLIDIMPAYQRIAARVIKDMRKAIDL